LAVRKASLSRDSARRRGNRGRGGPDRAAHGEVVGAADGYAWLGCSGRHLRGRRGQTGPPLHGVRLRSGRNIHQWWRIDDNRVDGVVHRGWGKLEMAVARGFSGDELLPESSRKVARGLLRARMGGGGGGGNGHRRALRAAPLATAVLTRGKKKKKITAPRGPYSGEGRGGEGPESALVRAARQRGSGGAGGRRPTVTRRRVAWAERQGRLSRWADPLSAVSFFI
jgi:hypothetical protein